MEMEPPTIPSRSPFERRSRRAESYGPFDAPVDDLSYRWKRGEQPPPDREVTRARRGELGRVVDEDVPEREPFAGPTVGPENFLTRRERAQRDALIEPGTEHHRNRLRLLDRIEETKDRLRQTPSELQSEYSALREQLGNLHRDYRKILYPSEPKKWTRDLLSDYEMSAEHPITQKLYGAMDDATRRYELHKYQGPDELITPRKFEGESPEIVVGGRTGVVDFSVPPETNIATGKPEHLFRAEDGFERRIQLERHLQGGRWEDQPDAPDIYERIKTDPTVTSGDIQRYFDSAFGRNHPAVAVVYEAIQKKVPFSELKKWLGSVDTYKQVDEEYSGMEVEPQQTYRTRVPGSRFVPETDVIVPDTGESLGLTGDPLWREQGTPISGEDRKRVFELTAMGRDPSRTDADRIESLREAVAISDRFSGEPAAEARALLAKLDKKVWTEEDLRNAGITEPDAHRALQILGDWSLALVQGSVGVVNAAVSMADWVVPGDMRATLKNAGLDPHETEQLLDNYYSNFTKKFRYTQQEADGLLEHFNLLMGNPSQLTNSLLRTLPLLAMQGQIAGKGMKIAQNLASRLYATKRTVQAGDTYRGLANAMGQSEKMLRSVNSRKALIPGEIMKLPAKIGPSEFRSLGRGVEGLLAAASMDPTSSGWARLATAMSTSAFGAIGGTSARVFGARDFDDVLTFIGSGRISPQALASIARRAGPEALDALNTQARTAARRIGRGGVTEMFEETGQSSMETLIANLDAGRPAMEGVDQAAVEGGLVGFMLGASMNVPSGSTRAQAHEAMVEKAAAAIERVESGDIPGGLQEVEDIRTAQTADPFGDREGEAQPRTREQFTREFGGLSAEGQPDLRTTPSNVVIFDDPAELDIEIPEGVGAYTDLETGITYMPSEALYKSGLKDVGEIADDYAQVQAHEANNILAAQLLGGESLVGQLQDDAKNVASEDDFEAIVGVDRETFKNDVERLVETLSRGLAGNIHWKTQDYVKRNRERFKELTPEARAQDVLAYELGVRSLASQDFVSQVEAGAVDISFTGPDAVQQGERERPEVQDAHYSRMVDPITERDQELRSQIDDSIQGVLLTLFEGAPDQQTRVRTLKQLAKRDEKQLKSFAKGLTGTAGKTKAVAIERLTRFFDLVDAARDESKLGHFKALFDQSVSEHGGNAVLAFKDAFNQLSRDEQNILGSIQDIQSEFGDFIKGYGKTKPELIFRALQRADQGHRTFKRHLLASREYVEVETQKQKLERLDEVWRKTGARGTVQAMSRMAKVVQETPPHLRPKLESSLLVGKILNEIQGDFYNYTIGDEGFYNRAVDAMKADIGEEAANKATEQGFVPIKYVVEAIAAHEEIAPETIEVLSSFLDNPAFDSIGDRRIGDPGKDDWVNRHIPIRRGTDEVVSPFRGLATLGMETVSQFNSHAQDEARQARMELTGETEAEIKAEGDLTLRDFARLVMDAKAQTEKVEAVKVEKDKPSEDAAKEAREAAEKEKVAKKKREAAEAKKARKRDLARRNADAIAARLLDELHWDLLQQARRTDPNVDKQDVRAAVDRAVEYWQDEQVEAEGVGQDARTLLQAIASYGGLSSMREAGNWHDGKKWHPPRGTRLKAKPNEEIESIRGHSISRKRGRQDLLGIDGVFQQVKGKTLEEMAEALVADGSGRFDHFRDSSGLYDSSKLWDELDRIVTQHKDEDLGLSQDLIPSAQDLEKSALRPNERWWEVGAPFGPPRGELTEAEGIAARIEEASSLEQKTEILNKVVEFITRKADEGDAQAAAYLAFLASGPESFSGPLSDDVIQNAFDRMREENPQIGSTFSGFSSEWDGWMLSELAKDDDGNAVIVPSQVLAERFGDISFVDEDAQLSFESDTPDTNDLRQTIMQTLLAFDVKLDVLDLQVRVNTSDTKKAEAFAFFEPDDMSITLGGIIHQQTFAHEFSHYVDVLFGLALGFDPKREVYLSEVSSKDEALRTQILDGPNGQAGLDFLDQFNEFREKYLRPMVLESDLPGATDYAEAFAKLGELFVREVNGIESEILKEYPSYVAAFADFTKLLASYSALEGAVERKKQLAGARDAVRGLSREALSEILESEKAGKDAPSHHMDPRPAPVSIVNEFLAMDFGPFIEDGFTRLPAWFEERKENESLLRDNPRLLTHPSAKSWKENEALIESWNNGNDSILKMLRERIQSLYIFGSGSISLTQKIAEGLPGTSSQNMAFLTDASRANLANPSNPKGSGDGRTTAGQARRIWEHPDTPRVIIDALFELWNNPRGVTPRIKRQSLEEDLADVRSFDAQLAEMSDPKFGSRDQVERVFESVWNSARDVGVEKLLSELKAQERSIVEFFMRQQRDVIPLALKSDLSWKEVFTKAPPHLLASMVRGLLVRDVRGNRQKEIVEFLAALPSSSSDMIITSTNTLIPRTGRDPLQRFLESYQRDTKLIINPIQEVKPLPKMKLDQNPLVTKLRRVGEATDRSWVDERHQIEMDSSRVQEMFDRVVEATRWGKLGLVPGTPSEDAIELIVLNNIIDVPRILGVSPEVFRNAIAPRTGGNVQALQEKLNHRVPLIAKWTGLQNLAFLANRNVSHADIELLVNSINVESSGRARRRVGELGFVMDDVRWGEESSGQALRNALVRAFMAINSHIDLSFLNVSVDSATFNNPAARSAVGLWEPSTLTLHAALGLFDKTGPEQLHNTIAHEMGHVLDYMWGVELGLGTRPSVDVDRGGDVRPFNPGLLSAFMSVVDSNGMSLVFRGMENKGVSDVRVEWTKRYLNFIDRISRVSRISPRVEDPSFGYWQRAEEVFARFMDSWMRWQETQVAGRRVRAESATYGDKFTQAHFEEFVRLLQEKAYVDAVDGNPNQVTPGDTRGKSFEALMSQEVFPNGAPPLYSTIEKYVREEMGVKESIRSLLQTLKSRPAIRALPAKTAKEAKKLGFRIKENHLKWSNIEPWLSGLLEKGQKHVTRDEVIGFLQASALDIVVSEAIPENVRDQIYDSALRELTLEPGQAVVINPDELVAGIADDDPGDSLLRREGRLDIRQRGKYDLEALPREIYERELAQRRPLVRYAGGRGWGMQLPEGADPSGYRELSLILRPRSGADTTHPQPALGASAVRPYAGHGFPANTTVWVRFQERPHAGTPTPPEEMLREVLEKRPDVRNRFGSQGAEVVHGAIQELIDDIIAEGGITRSNALEEMTGWAITLDIDNDVNQVSESPRAHLTSSEAGKGLWMPGRRQIFTDESQRISAADFLTEGIPESVQGIPYMGSALQVGRHQRGVGSETSNTRKLENQQLQVSSHYDPFTGSGLGTGGYRVAGTEFLDSLALDDKGRKRIESVLESAEKEGYSATRRSREIFRALAQETGAVFTADMTPRQYLAQIFKDQTFGRGFDSPLHQHVLSENRGDYVDRSIYIHPSAGSDTEFVDRSDPAFRYDPRDSMLATPTSSRRGIPRFTVSVTYGSDLLPASQLLPQSDPGSVKASDLTDKLVRESNLIGDKEALLDTIPPDRLVYLPNMNGRIFNRLFGETFVDMALDGQRGIRTLGGVNLSGRGPRELSDFLFNHKDFVPMTQTPQVRDSAGKVAALIASSIEGGAERKISRNRELKKTLDFHIWITDATATEPFEKWIPLKDATREQLIEASESGQFTFISGMHRDNPDTSVRGDRTDEAWLKLLQGQMTIFSLADEFSIPTLELTEKFDGVPNATYGFIEEIPGQEQLDKKALEGDIDELYKSLFSVDSLGSGGRPTILELGYSPMYVGGAYTGVELNTENVRAGYKGGAREMRSPGFRPGEKSVGVAPSYVASNRPPRSQFRDDRSPREAVIQHYLDVAIKVLERSLNPYESTPRSKTMDRLREADKKRYDIGLSPDALIPVTEENKEELFAALNKLQMFNSRLNRLISERDASSRIPIHRTPKEAPPDIPRTLLDRILADLKSPDEKFLLIGEIQSDWHQKYASTGFSTGRFLKLLKAAGLKREDLFAPFAGVTSHPDVKGALRAEDQRKEKLSVVARALIDQHVKDDRNIPSAERLKNRLTKKTEVTLAREFPHLTNWEKVQLFTLVSEALRRPEVDSPFATTHVELALKRMVYYAAQNGFTSMGWVGAESKAAAVGGGARGEADVSWGSRLALLDPDGKDSKFLEEYTFLDSQDVKGEDIGQFEGSRENEIDKFVRKYNLIEPAVWEALSNEVKDNFMKFVGDTIDSTGVSTTLGGVPAESVRAQDPRLGTKDPDYDFKALGDKRSGLTRVQGMLGLEAPTESGAAIDPITLSGLSTIQFMAVDAGDPRLGTKDPDFIAVNSYTGRWINGTRKFRHDKALGEQVIFGLAEGTSPSAMLGAEISAAVANSDGPGHGTIMMGGDGKAVQYDTNMPKYARKFLKHFGVKLEHRVVPASRSEGPDFLAEEGAVTDRMSVDRGSAFDYWHFEITQEMRDSVLSGESIINAYPSQRPTVAYADVEKVARKRRQKVSQTINQFEDAGYVIEGKPGLLEEERQPTLLGDVRNQNIETPEMADAPFSLTQEVEEKEDDQGGLFGAIPPGKKRQAYTPEGETRRAREVSREIDTSRVSPDRRVSLTDDPADGSSPTELVGLRMDEINEIIEQLLATVSESGQKEIWPKVIPGLVRREGVRGSRLARHVHRYEPKIEMPRAFYDLYVDGAGDVIGDRKVEDLPQIGEALVISDIDVQLERDTPFFKDMLKEAERVLAAANDIRTRPGGEAKIEAAQEFVDKFEEEIRVRDYINVEYANELFMPTFDEEAGEYVEPDKEEIAGIMGRMLGHLIDWIPTRSMSGSLVSKLKALKNLTKRSIATSNGVIKDSELRKEMKAFSEMWRPLREGSRESLSKTKKGQSYLAYRDSAVELFADGWSALLVDPYFVKENAPKFFNTVMDTLDEPGNKEIKKAYIQMLHIATGGADSRDRASLERLDRNLRIAERKVRDVLAETRMALESDETWGERMLRGFVDKHTWFYQRMAELERKGVKVEEGEDASVALSEMAYISGPVQALLSRSFEKMYRNMREAGIPWHDYNLHVQLRRVASGDRLDIASPGVITQEIAQADMAKQNEELTEKYGEDAVRIFEEADDLLSETIAEVMQEALKSGTLSQERYEDLMERRAEGRFYVTFRAVTHLWDDVSPFIEKQEGMIGPVAGAADETMVKLVRMSRFAQRNTITRTAMDFIDKYFPNDSSKPVTEGPEPHDVTTEEVRGVRKSKFKETTGEGPRKRHLILFWVNGEAQGRYVDEVVASSFNQQENKTLRALVKVFSELNAGFLRPVYTMANPAFQISNFFRDWWRSYKSQSERTGEGFYNPFTKKIQKLPWWVGGQYMQKLVGKTTGRGPNYVSFLQHAKSYFGEAHRLARARAFGERERRGFMLKFGPLEKRIFDRDLTETQREESKKAIEDLMAARQSKAFSVTMNEFIKGQTPEDQEFAEGIEVYLRRYGTHPQRGLTDTERKKIHAPFFQLVDFIKNVGDYIETLPKAAALYRAAEGTGINESTEAILAIPAAKKRFIRERVGSPDFLAGGDQKVWSNEIFIFSNAITQAWRGDIRTATEPQTRLGYWWKTTVFTIFPKVLMAMGANGLLGGGDDEEYRPGEEGNWRQALQGFFRSISNYMKMNYIIVPLFRNPNGNVEYVSLPQDDVGRVIGGITYNLVDQMIKNDDEGVRSLAPIVDTMWSAVDYAGAQLPTMHPLITTGAQTWDLGRLAQDRTGREEGPQDYFFDRPIVPPSERGFALEMRRREGDFLPSAEGYIPSFLAYQWNQWGGRIIFTAGQREATLTEQTGLSFIQKLRGQAVIGNMVGRLVRESDFGSTEETQIIGRSSELARAAENRELESLARDVVREHIDSIGMESIRGQLRGDGVGGVRELDRTVNSLAVEVYDRTYGEPPLEGIPGPLGVDSAYGRDMMSVIRNDVQNAIVRDTNTGRINGIDYWSFRNFSPQGKADALVDLLDRRGSMVLYQTANTLINLGALSRRYLEDVNAPEDWRNLGDAFADGNVEYQVFLEGRQ